MTKIFGISAPKLSKTNCILIFSGLVLPLINVGISVETAYFKRKTKIYVYSEYRRICNGSLGYTLALNINGMIAAIPERVI